MEQEQEPPPKPQGAHAGLAACAHVPCAAPQRRPRTAGALATAGPSPARASVSSIATGDLLLSDGEADGEASAAAWVGSGARNSEEDAEVAMIVGASSQHAAPASKPASPAPPAEAPLACISPDPTAPAPKSIAASPRASDGSLGVGAHGGAPSSTHGRSRRSSTKPEPAEEVGGQQQVLLGRSSVVSEAPHSPQHSEAYSMEADQGEMSGDEDVAIDDGESEEEEQKSVGGGGAASQGGKSHGGASVAAAGASHAHPVGGDEGYSEPFSPSSSVGAQSIAGHSVGAPSASRPASARSAAYSTGSMAGHSMRTPPSVGGGHSMAYSATASHDSGTLGHSVHAPSASTRPPADRASVHAPSAGRPASARSRSRQRPHAPVHGASPDSDDDLQPRIEQLPQFGFAPQPYQPLHVQHRAGATASGPPSPGSHRPPSPSHSRRSSVCSMASSTAYSYSTQHSGALQGALVGDVRTPSSSVYGGASTHRAARPASASVHGRPVADVLADLTRRHPATWGVRDVGTWVEHIAGLGQYRKKFMHQCIDGRLLLQLTDAQMKVREGGALCV